MLCCLHCEFKCSNPTLLLRHYQFQHNYATSSVYICAQSDCVRRFTKKKEFS